MRTSAVIGAVLGSVAALVPSPASTAVDAATITTVAVGPMPWGVSISPDSTTAVIGISGSDTVSVVDLSSSTVTRTLVTGAGAAGVLYVSTGQIAVTNYTAATVTWIDPSSWSVATTVPSSCSQVLNVAEGPDPGRVSVDCYRSIKTSTPSSGSIGLLVNSSLTENHGALAFAAGGAQLWDAQPGPSPYFRQIAVYESPTWNVPAHTIALSSTPQALAITPDQDTVLVGTTTGDMIWIDRATTAVSRTVPLGTNIGGIAISADSATAYVADFGADEILAVSLESGSILARYPTGDGPRNIALSSDGRRLVTADNNAGTATIVLLPQPEATGASVPRAAIQQFGRPEGAACATPPTLDDFPALGTVRDEAWAPSWAQWPNGGEGGFVCTRQPYYTTAGTWTVR